MPFAQVPGPGLPWVSVRGPNRYGAAPKAAWGNWRLLVHKRGTRGTARGGTASGDSDAFSKRGTAALHNCGNNSKWRTR
jgi:hypothetical protein